MKRRPRCTLAGTVQQPACQTPEISRMICPTRGATRVAHEPCPQVGVLPRLARAGRSQTRFRRSQCAGRYRGPAPPVNDAWSEATNLRCQSRCNGERLWACNATAGGGAAQPAPPKRARAQPTNARLPARSMASPRCPLS
jgi:hypothetical protein